MMEQNKKPIITIKNVFFGYTKGEPIIVDASFDIMQGEFVGVIGPNGGGKTTLLRLMMGFITPWSGKITVFGKAPTRYPNGIAYVPQNLRFDKQFPITVLELVLGGRISSLSWFGHFCKEDRDKAIDALEKVGPADIKDKSFGTLSGGQAQRALIARALAQEPKILLLDEPTANIDVQAESDMYELLHKIRSSLTVVMVTHDIRAIIHQVERVLCVQGKVTIIEPKELCEHFALGLYHFPLIETANGHFRKPQAFAKTNFPL
jgi:zinc transport system ATP-binding protein